MYDFEVDQFLIKKGIYFILHCFICRPSDSGCSGMLRIEPLPVANKKSYEEVVLYQQIITKKTGKIVSFFI
jgi:hypothetical protein